MLSNEYLKLQFKRCINTLKAETLDSVDYILLAVRIISGEANNQFIGEIKKIYQAFTFCDYDKAIALINTILPLLA